ncbi:macrophage migration inhibitory factor [Dermatophagoides farinae]|uniref:L-dopachrome isomerase n=1 Tax=Dermatophagoides farinae TaxID=6954 RepID=A0A922I375_DERFA|nr:macrophage migration inhibitory factor-like [Dermatophagoides farinae]KAH7641713.1 macrophage migration inhibitory factor-like protein [Dermatophagoides farinae]KAH9518302.1 hypothetical protein DERF_008892 [Dermatophagoides farinae]
MPTLIIRTNVAGSKVPANFTKDMVKIVAQTLGKPESYVVVMVHSDANLNWGGVEEPAAVCTLSSIGKISRDENKKSSAVIQKAIESKLGISTSRQYLVFEDLKKENVGYQSTTFDDLI